ncbi:TPA: hypothetical protein ACH3X1_005163 [Trebouxia sp. C0004]
MQPLQCCKIDDKMNCSSALPSLKFLSAYVFQASLINRPSNRQISCMDNMSVLRQALDILLFRVSVDEVAVKQAVIDHLAKEVCVAVRLQVPQAKFDVSDEVMQTYLATALANTQQQVIANPPTFVSIQRKYTKRASTPALSNASSLSTGLPNGAGGRAASPEVSSSNLSDPASTLSTGSLGVADFMDLGVLREPRNGALTSFQKQSWLGSSVTI